MSDEQLHFAISQYVDGTLPPAEAAALEKRLQADPAARRLLDEYRRIGDLMQVALPVPEMDWDKLSAQISAAIDREVLPIMGDADDAPTSYRIGVWKPLAMAAGVLLCATLALVLLKGKGETVGSPPTPVAQAVPSPETKTPETKTPAVALAMSQIQVLTSEKPSGSPVLEVQIGPAPDRKLNLADLYPEMASDYRPSVSIAADPSRPAMSDEFGIIQ
jgi:negative regulator of sigma E activity